MELTRMKMKLQDALASKTVVDDVNASLQVKYVMPILYELCVYLCPVSLLRL